MSDNQELASPVRDAPARPEPPGIAQLKPIIEAALLASGNPLTVPQLVDLFGEEHEVTRELVARTLEALAGDCEGRGVELREVASGFRYQVKQDVHPWLSRMWTERPSRYSRALLETLALIAYRQPITRPEIEQIRGVVVSSNIIKTLEERDWIRVVGHRDVPGRPALFGTTRAFLDYFNLKSLDELPPLSEIRDMEDPQLRFEPEPLPARVVKDLPIDPDAEIDAAADPDAATDDDLDTGGADDLAAAAQLAGAQAEARDADARDLETGTGEHPTSAAEHRDDVHPAPNGLATEPTTADEAAIPADADDGAADKYS
ncbi:MAG: SMC-Scp complex subunit ScpB [Xanthomonadaceae bacterium]|nr:SMC-Scp complex subunit ScpB [Xanthomonadaceae bacterium]